jgi:hypothetical protein
MTAALEGGSWSVARPNNTLPPGKIRYPLYTRMGEPKGRSGQVRKSRPPPPRIRSLDCPARSQSLYRRSYPAHVMYWAQSIHPLKSSCSYVYHKLLSWKFKVLSTQWVSLCVPCNFVQLTPFTFLFSDQWVAFLKEASPVLRAWKR